MRKRLSIAVVALLLAAVLAALAWVGRTGFVRFALERAVAASDGRLSYEQVEGTLLEGVRVGRIAWQERAPGSGGGPGSAFEALDLRVGWQPLSLLDRELDFTRLAARSLRVVLAGGGAAATLPEALALPFGVRIRDARIASLRLETADGQSQELRRIALSARYRAGAYRVERLRVESDYGVATLRGELGDGAPHRLVAAVQLDASWRAVSAAALIEGELARLRVSAAASAPGDPQASQAGEPSGEPAPARRAGVVSARFELRPFDAQPLGPIEIHADEVDPGALGLLPGFAMRWSGDARAQVELAAQRQPLRVTGSAEFVNADAGPMGAGRVPLSALSASFAWRDRLLTLDGLRTELAGGGRAEGSASIDTEHSIELLGSALPATRFDLTLQDLDLQLFAQALGTTRLAGRARADGRRFELELADRARGGAALSAAARIEGGVLAIERTALRSIPGLADATIDAAGTVELAAPYRLSLAGGFGRLDPSRLWAAFEQLAGPPARSRDPQRPPWADALARLAGSVDGRWALRTTIAPAAATPLELDLDVTQGTLAGSAVRATLRARLEGERLADSRLELSFGQTRVEAGGALGADGDRLAFSLSSARLEALAPLLGVEPLAGRLAASGALRGRFAAPGVSLQATGTGLLLPGGLRLATVELGAEVPELAGLAPDAGSRKPAPGAGAGSREAVTPLDSRVHLRADARGIALGAHSARSARIEVSGSARAHVFSASLDAQRIAVVASGRAGFDDGRWRATVDELASSGELVARLSAPLELDVRAGSVVAGPASIVADFGRLSLARAAWSDERFEIDGDASIDRLGLLIAAFQPKPSAGAPAGASSDASSGGATGATPGSSTAVADGAAATALDRGVLVLRARLSGSSLADVSGRLAASLQGTAALGATGEADLTLTQGALSGTLAVQVPSLAFTERIAGPEWLFDGRLGFSGQVTGTATRPRLSGELRGEALRLEQRAMGWRLGEGTLAARFDGERLRVDSLRLRSKAKGGGTIEMRGAVAVETLEGRFDFTADRLVVPIGPGQRVVLSGEAAATSTGGRFELSGRLRADEGRIELAGGDAPTLPGDVVIVDREAPGDRGEAAAAQRLRIVADLLLDLGENLRVQGSGVNARLTGEVSLKGTLPEAPRAYGTVRVRDGTYAAYGQELEITRGRVIFNGSLENPVLDIVALRREQAVEAGVALTGTVLAPRIRLTSRPDVPDAEKLSWLVLGQPLEGAEGAAQMAALQVAAATLFGTNDGGLSGGLRDALGLDVLTVRSASSASGLKPYGFGDAPAVPGQVGTGSASSSGAAATDSVVAIGKRLNSRVLLSYEQGLQGAWSVVRIQYDITRRLSLRGQTGTETALDLLLRYPFD